MTAAELDAIVSALVARHREDGSVGLNDIEETIGTRLASYEEVDAIIERLEGEGLEVGEAIGEREVARMKTVLEVARALAKSLGRKPNVAEIAAKASLPEHAVRRALEHATVVKKPH